MTMEEVVKDISVKETLVSQSGTSSSTVFREYFVDIEMDSGYYFIFSFHLGKSYAYLYFV